MLGAFATDADDELNLSREFFELAGPEQLDHFSATYLRGVVDEMDHQVTVLAESDPHALDGVDPSLIMRRGEAMRPMLDWRGEKENAGRFSWTLALFGTEKMAAEARMSSRSIGSRSSMPASWTKRTRSRAGARSATSSIARWRGSTACRSVACTSRARTST